MNILEQYQAIMLDMNSTFMFGEDRFGASEDFYSTYKQLGGTEFTPELVEHVIRDCYAGMLRDYEDPIRYDDFPSLQEGLMQYGGISEQHVAHLAATFALHEIGSVSDDYAALLRAWHKTHRLGVVSNIWGNKSPWLAEFRRAGIHDIWQAVVFSSDTRHIKPSLALFNKAVEAVDVPVSDILFIGDSIRVDMEPAKALGMDTLWITDSAEEHPMADYVAPSLFDIEDMAMS